MSDHQELLQQLRLDKNPPNTHRIPSWVAGLLVVILVGLSIMGYRYLSKPTPPPVITPPPIALSPTPTPASTTTTTTNKLLDASGYITARRMATVSAEVMGLIERVNVEEGMRVEEGQVLATIDDTQAQIDVQLAQAQTLTQQAMIQSIQADQTEAQRELTRIQNLVNAGKYSSEAQLTKAKTIVEKLTANLTSAQSELQVANLRVAQRQEYLNNHKIKAPFAGVITTKNAQAGEVIAPSAAGGGFTRTGICTIVDMNSLEIQVDVNEAYIGRVTENQAVTAVLDAYPTWNIPASVIAVVPTADRAKATVKVRIRLLESNPKILPEMGVKVSFLAGDKAP